VQSDHSRSPDETNPQTSEILALLAKVTEKLEPENNEMKLWMMQNFQNPAIIEILQEATLVMLRVINAVGQLEPVNGITISKQFRIPKGTVSKATRRLIAKKLIKKEGLANNKKEILFRLTPLGRELFLAHRAFDQQMEKGFVLFLQRYDTAELAFMVRVLQDILQTSFLYPERTVVSDDKTAKS
jgi:DNA-binding MarR family transcriptional regulator